MKGHDAAYVSAVIVRDGHVLLLKRAPNKRLLPGCWDPCSGRIEPGETPQQAVVREALEETGLRVEPCRVIDTFHIQDAPGQPDSTGLTFLCRAPHGDVRLSCEHTEARWVPLDDGFESYEMAIGLRDVLNALANEPKTCR